MPRGFDPDHPHAGLLLHNRLYAGRTAPVLAALHHPAAIDHCVGADRKMAPLMNWLAPAIQHAL